MSEVKRLIVGSNGNQILVSEPVASGLVGSGDASYADGGDGYEEVARERVLDEIPEPAVDGQVVDEAEPVDDGEVVDEAEPVDDGQVADWRDWTGENVSDVITHLESADEAERARVIEAESGAKARPTIVNWLPAE